MSMNLIELRDVRASAVAAPPYPWKTRLLLPAGLVLAVLAVLAYAARQALWPAIDVTVVPVVIKAGTESASNSTAAQAAGWIEADPYAVAVTALADGVVKEVLTLEGQTVEAGQIVARLIDDDARLALARAEAELEQRQAELAASQQHWDNPTERVRAVAVAQGVVAEIKAELDRLTPETAAEAARLEDLSAQFDLMKKSVEQQAASEVEYLSLKHRLDAQKATLDATRARRPSLEARLRQAEAELAAAGRHQALRIDDTKALAAAKSAAVHATAVRDEARLRLNRMEVRAPVAGTVLSRHVEPGSKLLLAMDDRHSATVVRLFDPQKLQVRVDVPLADAARIGVGAAAEIVVAVLPDQTFQGEVTRLVNEADLSKNTLQFKVAVKDPSPLLKPEMLARVRLLPTSPATAPGRPTVQLIFAPQSLITRDGDAAFVWVVDPSRNVAQRRTIELGGSKRSGWVSVRSGLSAGDRLIASPAGLQEGSRVRVVGEAETPEGADHGVH